jgi:cytochrome c oxidase subunit 2
MTPLAAFTAEASAYAARIDHIFYALTALSAIIALTVFTAVIVFAYRYRRGSPTPRPVMPKWMRHEFEIGWTLATLFLFLFIFWWAAATQISALTPPKSNLDIRIVAKQWMWKVEQPSGIREINELHVPSDTPVRLSMTSEDVIHSMFLPALRLKQDVLPDRYTYLWFTADRPGTYQLTCAEFCGAEHSRMAGKLVIMRPADYARWSATRPHTHDLASEGERLFSTLGCIGCHGPNASVHGPDLKGVFGSRVLLSDGRTVIADEQYLRNSILHPHQDVVAGFATVMPSFEGQVDEDELARLVAYIKSLSSKGVSR